MNKGTKIVMVILVVLSFFIAFDRFIKRSKIIVEKEKYQQKHELQRMDWQLRNLK